jgi:hypothetical protein
MDCELARRLLPFARPGSPDLEPADGAALNRHLDTCPACAGAAAVERAFDAGMARAMRTVPIPGAFHARLNTRLVAARMAIYRRLAVRGLLAAAALLAGWAGWAVWSRPVLSPDSLATQSYELTGQGKANDEAREAATNWLRQIEARLEAPDEFNYRYFSFPSRSDLQGLAGVPTLVFARNDATMRVYAVRESAFKDLAAFRDPVEVGGCTVEARRYPTMPGWVFVVVTTGAPPDDFRRPNRPLTPA